MMMMMMRRGWGVWGAVLLHAATMRTDSRSRNSTEERATSKAKGKQLGD